MAYCCGPLVRHTEQFSKFLVDQGYTPQTTPQTVKKKRTLTAKFGAWMGCQGLTLSKLNDAHLKQFLAHQRRVGPGDNFTGAQLLQFLRRIGVTPCLPPKIDRSPLRYTHSRIRELRQSACATMRFCCSWLDSACVVAKCFPSRWMIWTGRRVKFSYRVPVSNWCRSRV
jgi:hypothetical protein